MTTNTDLPERGQMWQLLFGAIERRGTQTYLLPEPWGSGRRLLVVLAIGRTWITAVDPSTLHIDRVHVKDWPKHRPQLVDNRPGRALRALRAKRAEFNRLGRIACGRCRWEGPPTNREDARAVLQIGSGCPACGGTVRWAHVSYPVKTLRQHLQALERGMR